jgi:uncharacterized protein YndB with AHSA1/START domain
MTIAPIQQTVTVKGPPERAFRLFSERMNDWWPDGKTIGPQPRAAVVMEPRVGGRWFEISEGGVETMWGKVLVWDPPQRLVVAWQIDASWQYDPDFETEIELLFTADGDRTRVDFEHRNLDRFGPSAAELAGLLGSGWPTILRLFAESGDGADM